MMEAREEFDEIDLNKDGFIDREEVRSMEEVPPEEEVDEFFHTYDADGDGKVSFEEIIQGDADDGGFDDYEEEGSIA